MRKNKSQIAISSAALIVGLVFSLLFIVDHDPVNLLISSGTIMFGIIGVILYHSKV